MVMVVKVMVMVTAVMVVTVCGVWTVVHDHVLDGIDVVACGTGIGMG